MNKVQCLEFPKSNNIFYGIIHFPFSFELELDHLEVCFVQKNISTLAASDNEQGNIGYNHPFTLDASFAAIVNEKLTSPRTRIPQLDL